MGPWSWLAAHDFLEMGEVVMSHTLDSAPLAEQRETSNLGLGDGTDGIQVRRMSLIEIIKSTLTDLHDRRRRSESYPHAEQLEQRIRGWEEILARLKELQGRFVTLAEANLPQ